MWQKYQLRRGKLREGSMRPCPRRATNTSSSDCQQLHQEVTSESRHRDDVVHCGFWRQFRPGLVSVIDPWTTGREGGSDELRFSAQNPRTLTLGDHVSPYVVNNKPQSLGVVFKAHHPRYCCPPVDMHCSGDYSGMADSKCADKGASATSISEA